MLHVLCFCIRILINSGRLSDARVRSRSKLGGLTAVLSRSSSKDPSLCWAAKFQRPGPQFWTRKISRYGLSSEHRGVSSPRIHGAETRKSFLHQRLGRKLSVHSARNECNRYPCLNGTELIGDLAWWSIMGRFPPSLLCSAHAIFKTYRQCGTDSNRPTLKALKANVEQPCATSLSPRKSLDVSFRE